MSHNPSPGRETGSPQVVREEKSLPYWEMLFRETIAIELLASVLVWIALWWNAPLELLADPQQTPKLAKAPWYFTGLQELLHYFPPFVAGIILPTLIVVALIVVPFFNVNIKDENLWVHHKPQRLAILSVILLALTILLVRFGAWDALVPAWIIAIFMGIAAASQGRRDKGFRSWLSAKPLSFWIMTWFLMEAVVLTSVGTFFRGPGWTWVLPW
jgi:Cytochrome b(C-terminal)/b6/petD